MIDLRLDLDSELVTNFDQSLSEGWSYLLPSKQITCGQSQAAKFLNSVEILTSAAHNLVIINLENQSKIFKVTS